MNRGFDVRRFPALVTTGFTTVAIVGTALAASINIASYGPDEWGPALSTAALILFPAVFPVFGVVVFVTAFGRVPVGLLYGALPRWMIAVGAVVAAYVFFNFFFLIHLVPGSAEDQGNPAHQALMYMARLFTGHEMVFFGASALAGYGLEQVRQGKLDLSRGPRDDSLERHPLPWPLSRSITIQTMLTGEECAQRLRAPIPQGFFAFMGRNGVRGEVTATGFRLELAGPQTSMVYAVGHFDGGARPTFIRVFLTFKRWALLGIAAAIVAYPAIWLVVNAFGQPLSWELLAFLLVFGIGGNLVFGIGQMASLLKQIKRATDGQEVSLG